MTYYQRKIPALNTDPSRVKPLRNQVLVRIADRVEMVGTIVVPDIARDLPNEGKVIAVGPRYTKRGEPWRGHPSLFGPGDQVAFEKHAHADREYMIFHEPDGKEGRYLLIKYEQVWAVLS